MNLDSANKKANAYIAEINKLIDEEKKNKQKLKDSLNELLLDATLAENKKEFEKVLDKLKQAQIIDPKNDEIKNRIKKAEFDLSFYSENSSSSEPKGDDSDFLNPSSSFLDNEHFLLGKSKSNQIKRIYKNDNDNFLNKEKSKSKKNNFLTYSDTKNKNKSSSNKVDNNFLNPKNK